MKENNLVKQKLTRLFEVDLANCKLSNEQWITWLADALTEPVKTLETVNRMSERYERERLLADDETAQLKHRLACIKKDMALIVSHIQSECSGAFHQPSRDVEGNVYADQAWHNVSNVEIACDLDNDEALGWTA